MSHEGGGFAHNSSQNGPQQRVSLSPKLDNLPRKDNKLRNSSGKKVDNYNSNTDTVKFLGPDINPSVKVYEDDDLIKQGTGGNIETGRFDQGLGSTLKKTPNYLDSEGNDKKHGNNYNNAAILVPELNLSPRQSDSEEKNIQQIKNNQRKLFENIQAHYVNNSGMNLSTSRVKSKNNSKYQNEQSPSQQSSVLRNKNK